MKLKSTDPEFAKRFWATVKIGNPWECWPWLSWITDGYGQLKVDNKMKRAHVIAWILWHKGRLLEHYGLHECDYKRCCNPFHVFDGTSSVNVKMASDRGQIRGQRGARLLRGD
jgi:hypothetical protein